MADNPYAQYVPPQLAPGENPYARYSADAPPSVPPGVMIHDAGGVSRYPGGASATIPQNDPQAAQTALEALRQRQGGRDLGPVGRGLAPIEQGLSFNLGDEAIAGAVGAARAAKGGKFADEYAIAKAIQQQELDRERSEHPVRAALGEIGGGVATGVGATSGLGLTAARYVPQGLQGAARLGANVGASMADAGAMGAISGFGAGNGAADSAVQAGKGALEGAAIGGALPVVGRVADMALQPVAGRLIPESVTAAREMALYRRAGMTPQQAAAALAQAGQDAQGGVYTLADALGHAGQRALSGVTRIPQNERQAIVDFLEQRQAGQGRRVRQALDDGFEQNGTATQLENRLTTQRSNDAATNYGNARNDAGAVNVTPAVELADATLTPGVNQVAAPRADLPADSIQAVLMQARRFLTNDRSQVSRFPEAFRAKMELDNLIDRASPTQQRLLIPIRNALDDQLAAASETYAGARDTFRTQSGRIDAIQEGREAALRGRPEDTVDRFNQLLPSQREGYRAGYSDSKVSDTFTPHGVNKVRPLTSDDFQMEAAAIAPRNEPMQRRLAREMQMFETRRLATGGSNTAENLADSAEHALPDLSILANLAHGNPMPALHRAGAYIAGTSPTVAENMSRRLLARDPQAVVNSANAARDTIMRRERAWNTLDRIGAAGALPLLTGGY